MTNKELNTNKENKFSVKGLINKLRKRESERKAVLDKVLKKK